MNLPNANNLYSFLEVAKTQNMSRAAERLGLSQPALSQAMKRLENAFDQQLLLRSKAGVVLTKSGERLAQRSRLLLEQWQKLKDDALEEAETAKGTYSLGLHASVGLYTLPFFVSELLGEFTGLELRLEHDLSRRVTEKIISFKLDFGIVVNPIAHPDLVIKELFTDKVSFYQSQKINPENKKVLVIEPDLNQTQELLGKTKKKRDVFERVVTSQSLEVIKSLVLSGAGVGILPGRVVGLEAKRLEILPGYPQFTDRICLVFRHDFQKSLASRELSQFIYRKLKSS